MLAGRSILVVEDEMLVLMGIENLLEDLGCTSIHAVATVAEALDLTEEVSFDAALLDVNLGAGDSYPIAKALIAAGIPFLFSTGQSGHGDRLDFASVPVLKKPYVSDQLTVQLRRLLEPWRHLPRRRPHMVVMKLRIH